MPKSSSSKAKVVGIQPGNMGIYPDHGVAYYLEMQNGSRKCIANTKKTDARLLASKYYAERKYSWFDNWTPRCTPMKDTDFDVELTDGEKMFLEKQLEAEGDQIENHGWFDIFSISDTFEG